MFDKTREKILEPVRNTGTLAIAAIVIACIALAVAIAKGAK